MQSINWVIYIMSGIKLLICQKLPTKYVKFALLYLNILDTKQEDLI